MQMGARAPSAPPPVAPLITDERVVYRSRFASKNAFVHKIKKVNDSNFLPVDKNIKTLIHAGGQAVELGPFEVQILFQLVSFK